MQTITISITDAFKVRRNLKACIQKNLNELRCVPAFYDSETEYKTPNTIRRKFGSIEGLMKLIEAEQTALGELNTAVDRANVDVRPYLNKVESMRASLNMYETTLNNIERSSDIRESKEIDGTRNITKLTATYSDDVVTLITENIKATKRAILETETKISELNGSTKLSFQVEDVVYNDIYNI